MRIAISGSSGLIGAALVAELAGRGHSVKPIQRRRSDEGIYWNPAAGEVDRAAFEGLDAVVHLAGAPIGEHRWTPAVKDDIRRSRIEGTRLLAEAVTQLDSPPSYVLSGSAIGIYGDRGDETLTEDSALGEGFLAQLCIDWEAATKPIEAAGIGVGLARTGIVLSPDGGALARMLLPFRLGLGGRNGTGRQFMSWIALSDEVRALAYMVEHALCGPINLVAPHPVRNAEFASTLGRVLRRPTTVTPMFGPRLLFGRELADTLLLDSDRVEPARLTADGFDFELPQLEPALRHLLA